MRLKHLSIISLIVTVGQVKLACAQYSFEHKPAVTSVEYNKWKVNNDTDEKTGYSITVPNFFDNHQALSVTILGDKEKDSCQVRIFKGGKIIGSFVDSLHISKTGPHPKAVFLEDINGDGLKDLKILIPFYGYCGGFNFYTQIIYLFQQRNNRLKVILFTDWMDDENYPNRPERDFDGDHNFEIITKTFTAYGSHNYELYNIYNFRNGKLVNVNNKVGYPILIQLLWAPNYKVTNKVARSTIKGMSRFLPDDFKQINLR